MHKSVNFKNEVHNFEIIRILVYLPSNSSKQDRFTKGLYVKNKRVGITYPKKKVWKINIIDTKYSMVEIMIITGWIVFLFSFHCVIHLNSKKQYNALYIGKQYYYR